MTAQQSFLQYLSQHQDDLKAFIGSLVTDRAHREDIFQETALTLWRKFDEFDHARSFGAWARGVAAKKILQAKRSNQRFPAPFDPVLIAQIQDAFEATEDEVSLRERALQHCLKKLPEKSRDLLDHHYRQRRSGAAIARTSGRTSAAVFKHLSRIRQQLARCMEDYQKHFEL